MNIPIFKYVNHWPQAKNVEFTGTSRIHFQKRIRSLLNLFLNCHIRRLKSFSLLYHYKCFIVRHTYSTYKMRPEVESCSSGNISATYGLSVEVERAGHRTDVHHYKFIDGHYSRTRKVQCLLREQDSDGSHNG